MAEPVNVVEAIDDRRGVGGGKAEPRRFVFRS